MKILISERMSARRSCIVTFGKPVIGLLCLHAWFLHVWRTSRAFRERLALKGFLPSVRFSIKALVYALTALTLSASCSAWAADIPAMSASGTACSEPSVVAVATAAAPAITAATDAALAAATGNATGDADISRDEAAAGLFGKHNFTASGIATGEICAFCHAPQGWKPASQRHCVEPLTLASERLPGYSTLGSAPLLHQALCPWPVSPAMTAPRLRTS